MTDIVLEDELKGIYKNDMIMAGEIFGCQGNKNYWHPRHQRLEW